MSISFTLARTPTVSLSAEELLGSLRRRGRLLSLVREALVEKLLVEEARRAGITVETTELQAASDAFRQRTGLHSRAATQAWLAREHLSVADFEAAVERELLADKVRRRLTDSLITPRFEQQRAEYDRLVLQQILVPREDLARELLVQMTEERRDFAELAREHSQHPSRSTGGQAGPIFRCQLLPVLREALAAAQRGEVVGPLGIPEGFVLVRLQEVQPAQLDKMTEELIRQELYRDWLRQQLAELTIDLTLASPA